VRNLPIVESPFLFLAITSFLFLFCYKAFQGCVLSLFPFCCSAFQGCALFLFPFYCSAPPRGALFFCFLSIATHPKGALFFYFLSVAAHPEGAHILPSTKSPFLSSHHSLSLSFLLQCILGVCSLFVSFLLKCISGVHYLSPFCWISFSLSMAIVFSLFLLPIAMDPRGAHVLSFLLNQFLSP